MDNNYFDLQGGGGIINPDFCDERCALRNLFGLAFPRKRLRTPPTWLFARGLSVARLGGASPSLTDWIGPRVHRTTLCVFRRLFIQGGHAL